jgi:hypothetical protein
VQDAPLPFYPKSLESPLLDSPDQRGPTHPKGARHFTYGIDSLAIKYVIHLSVCMEDAQMLQALQDSHVAKP